MSLLAHALFAIQVVAPAKASSSSQEDAAARPRIEAALRRYFDASRADGAELAEVVSECKDHEELLTRVLNSKSFVVPAGAVALQGTIDSRYRFHADPVDPDPDPDAPAPTADDANSNDALFFGPAATGTLAPLVVYVPDSTRTFPFHDELAAEGTRAGRFVLLVPDERQNDQWNPIEHEHRRHVGPLRDLLLHHAIDPDRIFFVGSGRGGHAAWDVGLLYADRFAGLFPCNGALLHEGGYKTSGGVFLENAKSLAIFTVYNTSIDHGIEGCRYAAKRFKEWRYRFEAREETDFRTMGIAEAMGKLGPTTRDAHPREIVKRFNHLDEGEHFWLRALDRAPKEWDPTAVITLKVWPSDPMQQRETIWEQVKLACALLKGSVKDNRFAITTQGVGHVRVYFDPELVDFKKKVVVTLNGRARPPLTLERRAETLLQHVHETGDTARLYWAFHDFAVDG